MERPLHLIVTPDPDLPVEYRKDAWRIVLEYPEPDGDGTAFSAFAMISYSGHQGAVDALLSIVGGQATCVVNHEPNVSLWEWVPAHV